MSKKDKQDVKKESQKPALDIEDFIVGLFLFVKRAALTLYDVAIHPTRVSEEYKHGLTVTKYLRPFTFLILITFVYVSVFRSAFVYWFVLNDGFARFLGNTSVGGGKFPELSEFMQMPSLIEITTIGIPVLLIVIVFSGLFCYLASPNCSRNYKYFLAINCYVVGFQMLIILAFIAIVATTFVKFTLPAWLAVLLLKSIVLLDIGQLNSYTFIHYILAAVFSVLILVIIIWPGITFSRIYLGYVPVESRRIKKKWSFLSFTFTSAIVIYCATIVSSAALAYPFAVSDFKNQPKYKSLMHGVILSSPEKGGVENQLVFMITNNTKKYITIRTEKFKIQLDGDGKKIDYEILNSWRRGAPIISIAPNESISLDGKSTNIREDVGMNKVIIILERILPDGSQDEVKIETKRLNEQ